MENQPVKLVPPNKSFRSTEDCVNGQEDQLEGILQGVQSSEDGTSRTDFNGMTNNQEGTTIPLGILTSSTFSENFPRLVKKNGDFGWTGKPVGTVHFFEDIFTTLVELQWRLLLLVFCIVYFGTWLLFGLAWYGLLYFHGDFSSENYGNSTWTPCISELKDFTGAFLFSVETQHTTGYGWYHLTEECASTIITFCIQSIVGCILEGVLVGIIFVKIARGKNRMATLLFSEYAVVNGSPNGALSFKFRLADLRNKSNLLEARIRAQLVTWHNFGDDPKRRGDLAIGQYTVKKTEIKVSAEGESETDFLLLWPTTIGHTITEESPLHKIFSPEEVKGQSQQHFEIIIVLEGHCSTSGQMTQARTSYLPDEIYHDHTFLPLTMKPKRSMLRSRVSSTYEIDYGNFNEIKPNQIKMVTRK